MAGNDETRIIARGLNPPGPLLLVKKKLEQIRSGQLRVIVSSEEAAAELVAFFKEQEIGVEIDRAGDDIHVVAELKEA